MSVTRTVSRRIAIALLAMAASAGSAAAADIHVVSSGGFAAALRALAPVYEQQSGNRLVLDWGPSMGETKDAVPQRLARHEPIDVVVMVGYALGQLVDKGQATDRVDLARSGIGVVVKQGAPVPDVSTEAALKADLLAAKSIAYSDSASGVYIEREMFKKMGIEDQVRGKARMIPATPVGEIVAKGEAEIGFQQISELKPIKGIVLAGPVPGSLQQITVFSAGIVKGSAQADAARDLIRFLGSPAAAQAVSESGLEPMAGKVTGK